MPTADKLRDLLAQGDWDKVASLLEGMDAQVAGDALQSISPDNQRILFQRLSTDTAAKIVAVLPYFEAYVLLHSRPLEDIQNSNRISPFLRRPHHAADGFHQQIPLGLLGQ